MSVNLLLYSSGLGYINRGLETFTRELYETLSQGNECHTTLFQGKGEVLPGAIPLWAPKRNAKLYDFLPFNLLKHKSIKIENAIFSLPIIFHCYSHPVQIIHFSETIPANLLYYLRRLIGGKYKLLLSNGGPASPSLFSRYDYIQVLTPSQKQQAIEYGYPDNRLFLVPYGLNCQPFANLNFQQAKQLEQQKWGLPIDRSIILSVGAINSTHKRMDWLIKEFSQLDPEQFFLWIVGQPEAETESINLLAASLLKQSSYKFDVIHYAQMPKVYSLVDYFVLCSLQEGFGRAYLEAMAAALPVIAHRNTNTEWILGSKNIGLINMTKSGSLKQSIATLHYNPERLRALGKANQEMVLHKFEWQNLRQQYIDMYLECLIN